MAKQEQVGQKEVVEATIHSNEFTLKMSGLSNLKFDLTEYSITSGQPWEGITKIECNGDKGVCTMTIMAGRKNSATNASWFADAIKPGSAIGCMSKDAMPQELNFAFKGNMSFDKGGKTYSGNDIVIGQGHTRPLPVVTKEHNNWWIGGPNMSVTVHVGPFAASAAQNFKVGPAIAKVTFSVSITDASTVCLGVITIKETEETK